jgi:DNA-binding SARP family transcriptional activator
VLHLYTFGGLQIVYDGQLLQLPTQKARLLLAYLFTFRNRPHPRSTLVGLLWPDLEEGRARRRLSDTLWRVRHVLGEHIIADEEQLCFNAEFIRYPLACASRAGRAHHS